MLKYTQGHVIPWWDNSFKKLNYIFYPLTNINSIKNGILKAVAGSLTVVDWST